MNKAPILMIGLLMCHLTTQAIFEDCHDRVFKYKVLAIVTALSLPKDIELSFDLQDPIDDDQHAVAQECVRHGYELVKTKDIKVIQRPIIITTKLYTVASTISHYHVIATVKRPNIQRPVVLEFARRLGITEERDNKKDIYKWATQECAKQDLFARSTESGT